jgi:hypothetical protein
MPVKHLLRRATVGSLLVTALVNAATAAPAASLGPKILFEGTHSTLTGAEKAAIFHELGFEISANGSSLEDSSCGPVDVNTQIVDLSGKGEQDVFVIGGNLCTSGDTGASVWLFMKDRAGHYRKQLGFPAGGVSALKSTFGSYHDLSFSGPGKCLPVWRWNGSEYKFFRSEDGAGASCTQ